MLLSLPVRNDLAGGRVVESPQASAVSQMKYNEVRNSELFLACAVTRAIVQAKSSPKFSLEQDKVHNN